MFGIVATSQAQLARIDRLSIGATFPGPGRNSQEIQITKADKVPEGNKEWLRSWAVQSFLMGIRKD